jgi:large subunit ribosomal protein L10
MASRAEKAAVVDTVKENFEKASAVVLVSFAGIDVPQITDLRARFREAGVEYKVVKNRLIRQALKGTGLDTDETFDASLKGMTGVAWSFEDPSAAAKIIKNFRKEDEKNEKLEVKCGLLQQDVLTAEQVEKNLASLPGKDELRAKLLATLQAPASNLVRLLQAAPQNFAYLLDARRRQLEEGGEG